MISRKANLISNDLMLTSSNLAVYIKGYEQGALNSNGTELNTYPTIRIRTKDFIKLEKNLYIECISSDTIIINIHCYTETKQWIGKAIDNLYINENKIKK